MDIMCIIMPIIFAFFIFEGAVCSRTITSRVISGIRIVLCVAAVISCVILVYITFSSPKIHELVIFIADKYGK